MIECYVYMAYPRLSIPEVVVGLGRTLVGRLLSEILLVVGFREVTTVCYGFT